jgi:hypothetical protein
MVLDYSIANHLKYLKEKWVTEDQLDINNKRIYKRGEAIHKNGLPKNQMIIMRVVVTVVV